MLKVKDKGEYLDIRVGSSRVKFKKQCKLTRTINDLLIGFFFVFGSLFNFFEVASMFGNVLYLCGSTILACRSICAIKENMSVEQEAEEPELHNSYY